MSRKPTSIGHEKEAEDEYLMSDNDLDLESNFLEAARNATRARAPLRRERRVHFANTHSPPPRDRTMYVKLFGLLKRVHDLEEELKANSTLKLENKILIRRLEKLRKENELLSTMIEVPEAPVPIDPARALEINCFLRTALWTDNALSKAFDQLKLWVGNLREQLDPDHALLPVLIHWHTNNFYRFRFIELREIEGQYQMLSNELASNYRDGDNQEYLRARIPYECVDELLILYVHLEKYRDDADIHLDIREMLTLIMKIRLACPNQQTEDLHTYNDAKAFKEGSLASKIRDVRVKNPTDINALFGTHLRILFAIAELSLAELGMDDLQQVRDICTEIAVWAVKLGDSCSKDDPLQLRTRLIYEDATSLILPIMHGICGSTVTMDELHEKIHDDWDRAKISASVAESQFLLGSAYTRCLRRVDDWDPEAEFEPAFLYTNVQRKERIIMSLEDIPHCSICLKTWDDRKQRAVLSSCSHTVCQECRDQFQEMKQPNCPVCRSVHFARDTYRNRALEEATVNVLTWRGKAEKLEKQLNKETIVNLVDRNLLVQAIRSTRKARAHVETRLKKTIEGNAKLTRKYYQQALRGHRSRKLFVSAGTKLPAERTIGKQPSIRKRLPRACKSAKF